MRLLLYALNIKIQRRVYLRKKNGKKMAILRNSFQGNIAQQIHIAAQNAQSLRNNKAKYQQIETFLLKEDVAILGLSETNCPERNHLKNKWFKFSPIKETFTIIEDNNTDPFQGTALIIKKCLSRYIQKTFILPGRLTGVLLHRQNFKLLVLNIYMPSSPQAKKELYRSTERFIKDILKENANVQTIFIGDFNAAPDPIADREPPNYSTRNEIPLFLWLQRNDFTDSFRYFNKHRREFSHASGGRLSRIDLCFHRNLTNKIINCEILPDAWIDSHHLTIKTTLVLPSSLQRPRKLDPKPHRVKLNSVTSQQWENFQNLLEANGHLSRIANKYTLQTKQPSQYQTVGHLHQLLNTMKSVAKKTLPHYNPNLPPKRKHRTLPLHVVRDLNCILQISGKIKFSRPLSELDQSNLDKIRLQFNLPTSESNEKQVKTIKKAMKKNIHRLTQERITAACTLKEATFLENIKKNISNVFDKGSSPTIDFWNDNGQIVTETAEFLEYAHNHYQNNLFKDHQNQPIALNTIPANWRKEYTPKPEIDSNWYLELKIPLTMLKLDVLIKQLPNKKASGPTQISNEMLKHLGPKSRVILLAVINTMLRTNKIPAILLKNLMILIAKEKEFSGNISKTRPIALQETIKKLLSTHITKTLSSIIERNGVLRGFNSGFTANESTKDVIFTIKNIIDISNQTKHPLYIASLDIKGAYDTVKQASLKLALQRIKLPDNIIELILNLEMERSITLITNKGNTKEIQPEQSLPQGSPMAPILWKIHMDPLLTHLASLNQGFPLIPNMDISTAAFADDSYLLTDDAKKLQSLIDCTDEFLTIHDQHLSAQKTAILRNPSAEKQQDFIFQLKSSRLPINNLPRSSTLHRFLGCWLTMDSNTLPTIQDTKTKLDGLLHFIRTKFNPGYITVYLVKTVIIPIVLYRLQASPISKSTALAIDRKFNKLLKQKYKVPMQTPTFILRHPEILNIPSLRSQLDRDIISTTLEMISQPQKHSAKIFFACIEKTKQMHSLRHSPFYAPIELQGRNKFLIPHISNALLELDIALRELPGITRPHDAPIVDILSHKEYAHNYQSLANIKLYTVQDLIATNTNTVMPFSSYQTRLTHARLTKATASDPTPSSYKLVVSKLTGTPINQIGWTSAFQLKDEYSQRLQDRRHLQIPAGSPNTKLPLKTSPLNPTIEPLDVTIYTDGSLQKQYQNMGAASISILPDGTETILQTSLDGSRNSTRAEIVAITEALASWPSNANITIFTDSMTSIHTLERLQKSRIIPFKHAHKYSNSAINCLLHHILHQRDGSTKCVKVAAHTGITLNERVDKLAKAAVSMKYSTTLYNYLPSKPHALSYVYHNKWMYDMNPKTIIKKLHDREHINNIHGHILHQLGHNYSNIDVKLTCRILSSRAFANRILPLKESSFRMKLFSNALPLNGRPSKRALTSYCLRCSNATPETLEHFLNCPDNKTVAIPMQMQTIESLHRQLEGTSFHPKLIPILEKCQLLCPTSINNPLSKGIITKKLKTSIRTKFNITTHDCNVLLAIITDAWLQSLHDHLWKRRNLLNATGNLTLQTVQNLPTQKGKKYTQSKHS